MVLFVALSLAFAIVPVAESWSTVGPASLTYLAIVFLVTTSFEVLALSVASLVLRASRYQKLCVSIVFASLLAANVGYWFAITINAERAVLLLCTTAVAAGYWASFYFARGARYLVLFAFLFAGISLAKSVYEGMALRVDSPVAGGTAKRGLARTNIYVLSFDGLASRAALREFYGINEYPHVATLRALGFRVSDTMSAGDNTLSNFGKMFSLGRQFNPSVARSFFNGIRSVALYEKLRDNGYKIQFSFEGDFFGVDAGRLDYFYPRSESPSICTFVDHRYGIVACRSWLLRILSKELDIGTWDSEEERREAELARVVRLFGSVADNDGGEHKWFSFSHFLFPGHTLTTFQFDDAKDARSYVQRVRGGLPKIAKYIDRAVAGIKKGDPDPIILIFGDHGGWLTRGAREGDVIEGKVISEEMLEVDRQGVLLAVYPRTFCREPLGKRRNIEFLFSDIIDCASGAMR